jgi:hypothetical protein
MAQSEKDFLLTLKRFFYTMVNFSIDFPRLIQFNDQLLEQIPSHFHDNLRQNIQKFSCYLSQISTAQGTPLSIPFDKYCDYCITPVLTFHHILKTTRFARYLDTYPFFHIPSLESSDSLKFVTNFILLGQKSYQRMKNDPSFTSKPDQDTDFHSLIYIIHLF